MALEDKLQEAAKNRDAGILANAIPLPGAAGDAFTEGPIKVGPFTVRKVVAGDWRTLQAIQNGLILLNAELQKPEGERTEVWDDQTDAELIWILTHTRQEVRAALAVGVEKFKERCMAETLDELDGAIAARLCDAVSEQIRRSSATIIKYGETEKEGGSSPTFFRDSTPAQKTA